MVVILTPQLKFLTDMYPRKRNLHIQTSIVQPALERFDVAISTGLPGRIKSSCTPYWMVEVQANTFGRITKTDSTLGSATIVAVDVAKSHNEMLIEPPEPARRRHARDIKKVQQRREPVEAAVLVSDRREKRESHCRMLKKFFRNYKSFRTKAFAQQHKSQRAMRQHSA